MLGKKYFEAENDIVVPMQFSFVNGLQSLTKKPQKNVKRSEGTAKGALENHSVSTRLFRAIQPFIGSLDDLFGGIRSVHRCCDTNANRHRSGG